MATKIVTKNSSTASAVPTASDLVQGELAVNVADKRLFTEDNGGSIIELGTNPSTIDINAGSIDGTTIGASSASTGAFTTLTASGAFTSLGIDDNADATAITIDSSENVGIGTSSPSSRLVASASNGGKGIELQPNTGSLQYLMAYDRSASDYIDMQIDAKNLIFGTNNSSERARLTSDGNLGIGTSSPSNKMSITGFNEMTLGFPAVSGGASRSGIKPTVTGAGAGQLEFLVGGDNNNEATTVGMAIDSSGNVGIGTSSPTAPLHVSGSTSTVPIKIDNTGTGGDTWRIWSTNDAASDGGGKLGFYNEDTATRAMTLDSSGNVGIGTSSPSSLLHLSSSAPTLQFSETDVGVQNYIQASGGGFNFFADDTNAASGTKMGFFIDGAERMRIDSSGNVGVGTSSPVLPLDIVANGGANALSLRTRAGDDYSFLTFRSNDGSEDLGGLTIHRTAALTSNLLFYTNNGGSAAERMRIDSSGNVGIGTSSPNAGSSGTQHSVLTVKGSGSLGNGIFELIQKGTTGNNQTLGEIKFFDNTNHNVSIEALRATSTDSGTLAFKTKAASGSLTERMRIDSSGNLLVGKTSTAFGTAGVVLRGDSAEGLIQATRANNECIEVNRIGTDGAIAIFAKDGTTVGSIGSAATGGGSIIIGNDSSGIMFRGDLTGSAFIPANPSTGAQVDNVLDIGHSVIRFDDIYATNGTIQTSDFNEKQDIAELSDAEQRVAVACKGLLRKFRWKSSVAEKGDEARTHFGIIAQDLQAAFAAEGLDASDYAMFISTTWTDEETNEEKTRMGVRYSELLAFIIAAI